MTTISLIRHGQASFGASNYDELSATGIRQSEFLGQHFERIGRRFDAVFCGEMQRQRHTAESSLEQMSGEQPNVQVLPAFNEYDADALFKAYLPQVMTDDPKLQQQSGQLLNDRATFQKAFERIIDSWVAGKDTADSGLEPFQGFVSRVSDGLTTLCEAAGKRDHIAIYTSGGPISASLRLALGLSDRMTFAVNWRVANSSVSELNYGQNGFSLMGFNNISHLHLAGEPELITWR